MIVIKKQILSIVTIIVLLLTFTVINVNATMVTPIPSGIDDSADYLLKVPDEGNYIYYAGWKAHGLVWSSFKTFGRHQYDSEQFLFSDSSGYIHTKTINGENFYEAEFNMEAITFDTLDGCNLLAIQPVQIQFDKVAFDKGESVPLGNYIDTTPYKYIATRIKIEGGKDSQKKILSVMLRAKGRDQYIDNMVGTYIINNNTRTVSGPTPDKKFIELENGFDGWLLIPVADMAEDKPLSELISVSFFCHSKGFEREKCKSHGVYDSAWDNATLYVGDMMLVKDVEKFNTVRTTCDVVGHKYGEPIIVNPTTSQYGTNTVACIICGKNEVTLLPKLAISINGNKVEGLAATAETIGETNISTEIIFKAQNITSTIKTTDKNTIIHGVNGLKDQIKSRKIVSILDLRLYSRNIDSSGKSVDTEFQMNGKIKITVPVDIATLNKYRNISLVYIADVDKAKLINYTIENGNAIFETDVLGYFAFVGGTKTASTQSEEKITESESEINSTVAENEEVVSEIIIDNEESNQKVDNSNLIKIVIIIAAAALLLGVMAFILIMVLKRKK